MSVVTTIEINNERVEISVNNAGRFQAEYDDQEFSTKTLDELTEQLKAAGKLAAETKAVDVTVIDHVLDSKARFDPLTKGIGVVHAKLRGKHERNDEWLLTSESGRKFKVRQWGDEQHICRRLTNEEVDEYTALARAAVAAEKALESWRHARRLDPEAALKRRK